MQERQHLFLINNCKIPYIIKDNSSNVMKRYKNILIADDHNLILDGFEHHLKEHFPEIQIWKAKNKTELFLILETKAIDVLFQDVVFGKNDAREFINEIKQQFPALKIVIISTLTDINTVNTLLKQGVNAYISKVDDSIELINALQALIKDELFISPDIQNLHSRVSTQKSVFITQREEKVLSLIIKGMTSKEIADELCLSIKTIEVHRSNLFARFGAKNVVELVKRAIFEGYT